MARTLVPIDRTSKAETVHYQIYVANDKIKKSALVNIIHQKVQFSSLLSLTRKKG